MKGAPLAVGGGEDLAARNDLGLQERGLVEQVVAVDVVAGHFEGDHVHAGLKLGGEVPLVHAEEAVRAAGWTVAEELAVEEHAVKRGARGPQEDLLLCGGLEAGAKADEQILLRLAALGPDRFGRYERRPGRREARAHEQK